MKIWKNILVYIKLSLISPALEIVINLFYIVSFIIIFAYFCDNGKYYSNNQISKFTESYLNYGDFKAINTPSEFKIYIENLINKLYTFNPSEEKIPILIPLNAIRITRFINKLCKEENFDISCNNNFHCIIESLTKSFKSKCGERYSKLNLEDDDSGDNNLDKKKLFLESLVNNFEGFYSNYDLLHDGRSLEITNDNFNTKVQELNNFIGNKNLKFISVEINLKAPINNNYIDVIFGLEMNEYFNEIKKILSINIFNSYSRPNENKFLFIIIIFFIVSTIINIIKLIYEIMVKAVFSIHLFIFLYEVCNTILMIFFIFYLNLDKKLPLEVDLKTFNTHLVYISLISYLKIIMIIVFIAIPLRFLALISWWKWLSSPFIKTANIFFRMFPGVVISFIISLVFLIVFSITNYLIFQDIFIEYENFYKAFLNVFNFRIIKSLYREENNSKIFHNLTYSKYVFIFLLFEYCFFLLSFSLFISAFVLLYKKANSIEEPLQQSEYLQKLDSLIEKLKENAEERNIDLVGIKKQILYLKLLPKSSNTIKSNNKIEVSFFQNSQQVISFLKYIFALKPELQFKNLISLLNIIIEVNHFENFNWNLDIEQIEYLINWLNFVGCKIPLIVFCEPNFEKNYHLKLYKEFNLIKFVNDYLELEVLVNKRDFGNFVIDNKLVFTFKAKKKNRLYI